MRNFYLQLDVTHIESKSQLTTCMRVKWPHSRIQTELQSEVFRSLGLLLAFHESKTKSRGKMKGGAETIYRDRMPMLFIRFSHWIFFFSIVIILVKTGVVFVYLIPNQVCQEERWKAGLTNSYHRESHFSPTMNS